MSITNKILAVLSGIGAILSTAFFFLFKSSKQQNELLEKDLKDLEKNNKVYADIQSAEEYSREKVKENKNDEKRKNYNSDSKLSNFNDGIDLLSK